MKSKNEPGLIEFSASISFEYDQKPVLTVQYRFARDSFENAFKTAVFRACGDYPRANPRSMVVVIEKVADQLPQDVSPEQDGTSAN